MRTVLRLGVLSVAISVASLATASKRSPWLAGPPTRNLDKLACPVIWSLFPLTPSADAQLPSIVRKRDWQPAAATGDDPTRFYPNRRRLLRDLYDSHRSPYYNLTAFRGRVGLRVELLYMSNGQRSAELLQSTVVRELGGPPRLVLEVGSFIGSSAIHVWGALSRQYKNITVLCADTWQGALMMRLGSHSDVFRFRAGYPDLATTFMRRVLTHGLDQTILPIALPSLLTARLLYLLGYRIDVIYVDSAHEMGETLVELHMFYLLLRPGGLLIGDDLEWPAVKHNVHLFTQCHNTTLMTLGGRGTKHWFVRKPMRGAGA